VGRSQKHGRSSSLFLTDRLRSVTLCYHAVSPTWEHRLCLPPALLLRQVKAVRRWAEVHVTFDDAFRSIVSVVPEVRGLGVPITIFVCSGYADRGGAPLLIPELAGDDPEQLATLPWDELRALAADGVEIGSHSLSHAHLTRVDDDALAREVRDSKLRVEDELGRACRLFAYPYGEHDDRVRGAVRAAGYERAYALWWRRGDPFATPRVDLYRRHGLVRTLARTAPFRPPPKLSLQTPPRSAETGVRTP
jgi:peptidoglycan/xylan/chitin deacetylase (PgdA/CDA1 family)